MILENRPGIWKEKGSREGYDLCVDVDYVDGEMTVDCSEEYYEGWEEDDEEEDEE